MNGLSFIRRRCNLSQGQLAAKLGVTRQAINLWENRREPLPEARKEQLGRFFGLDPELFDEIKDKTTYRQVDFDKAIKHNPMIKRSTLKSYERARFMRDFKKLPFEKVVKRYGNRLF